MASNAPNLAELTAPELSAFLSRFTGRPITTDMIREDFAHGVPTRNNGTTNLLWYFAWLIDQRRIRGGRQRYT